MESALPEILSPRELLSRLVAFPTVSRGSNLDLVDWLEDYLRSHGLVTGRQWNEDRTKAGLFAHAGPWEPGGVVLSGHSDVVPVDGQPWTTDPWTVVERDGRLYGRGTCDMKGFDALAIWALVEAHRLGVARPLQLALSYDEELGLLGAPPLIEAMAGALPKAREVIVGEPSRMKVITGHKGGAGYWVKVKGHEVHSSLLPYGVSAIMEAARLIGWINDRNAELQARPPSALAAMFDPPFTTLHTGMIEGGTAHNITAADCRFAFEMRVVPGETLEAWEGALRAEAARLTQAMQKVAPTTGITVERFFVAPPLVPESEGAAEALACRVTGENTVETVPYGTEAGHFQAAGYSVVVCGPGDIAQAHQPDEWLAVSEFEAGHRFMQRLLEVLK